MPHTLMRPDAVAARIAAGRPLVIAGEEALLAGLPRGRWIGGTAPAPDGWLVVTELPEAATAVAIRSYDEQALTGIGAAAPENGFTILAIPGFSPPHAAYAEGVFRVEGLFDRPLVGWIAAEHGARTPKVFDGVTGTVSDQVAVAAHVWLPPRLTPRAHVVNPYRPGDGDELVFGASGFSARHCRIGGEPVNLAAHMRERSIGQDRPLVADCFGTPVNVSVRAVDEDAGEVRFCAPVFAHLRYRFAAPLPPGAEPALPAGVRPAFACGCVRNPPLVAGLLGYGEIAYVVHNQTLAYLTIDETG
ncbi:DUF6976 family protein [Azospirillum sp.]|uniref:DUF6976 family protein n=1 Tax=Azospirillum sp. TaxID=34012 RepID=UPI003D7034D7